MIATRRPEEPPAAVARLGWRYHHLGIPHTDARPDEKYIDHLGIHVCGFETSPYGIEWIRFEAHCQVPALVKTTPHVAFAVDDLDDALRGQEVLIAPNAPSPGVRVAFIVHNGAPVELLEFTGAVRRNTVSDNAAEPALTEELSWVIPGEFPRARVIARSCEVAPDGARVRS